MFLEFVQRCRCRHREHVPGKRPQCGFRRRQQNVPDLYGTGRPSALIQQKKPARQFFERQSRFLEVIKKVLYTDRIGVRKPLGLHETAGDVRGIGNQLADPIGNLRIHFLENCISVFPVHLPEQVGAFITG